MKFLKWILFRHECKQLHVLVDVPLRFKKMAFIAGVQMLQSITVLSKTQTLQFKSRLHNCIFHCHQS